MPARTQNLIAIAVLAATAMVATTASAQKKYDPGAADTEIKIGNIMLYGGPASFFPIEQMQLMKFDGEAWERSATSSLARSVTDRHVDQLSDPQPALNRTPARRNFCGSTASPSIRVS